jgi:hypothetical protein
VPFALSQPTVWGVLVDGATRGVSEPQPTADSLARGLEFTRLERGVERPERRRALAPSTVELRAARERSRLSAGRVAEMRVRALGLRKNRAGSRRIGLGLRS